MEQEIKKNEIQVTKEYDTFKEVIGNRQIDINHVKKLVQSIKECDLSESNPIIVDKYLRIIDGQHRYYALKQLGYPIHYKIVESEKDALNIVQMLNTKMKNWTCKDYFQSFCKQGNINYIRLKDFLKYADIDLATFMSLYTPDNYKDFKEGKLIFDKTVEMEIIRLLPLYKAIKNKFPKTNTFIIRVVRPIKKNPNFKDSIFFKRLDQVPTNFLSLPSSRIHAKRIIEDIYNYNTTEKNKIRL